MTTKDFIKDLLAQEIVKRKKYVADNERHLNALGGYPEETKRPVRERLQLVQEQLSEAEHHYEVFKDQIVSQ